MPSEGYSYSTLRSRLRSLRKFEDASEKGSSIKAKSIAKNTYNVRQSSTKQRSPTSGPDTSGIHNEYRSPQNTRASRSNRKELFSERDVRSSHSPPPTSLDKSGIQNDYELHREGKQNMNQNARMSKNIQVNQTRNQSKSNPHSYMKSMSTRTVDHTSSSKRLQYLQHLRSMKSKSRSDPISTMEQKGGANRYHISKSQEKESDEVKPGPVHVHKNSQQNRQSIFKTNSIRKDEVHVNKARSVSFADDIQHEKEENESHSRKEHEKINERSKDLGDLRDVEHSLSRALEKNWEEKSDVREIAKALALAHTARRQLEKGNTHISKKELKRTLRKSETSILTKLQTMRSSKSTIRAASIPNVEKNGAIDVDSSRKRNQSSENMALETQDHEVEIEKITQKKSGEERLEVFSPPLSVNKELGDRKPNEPHVQKQKAKEIISKRMCKTMGDSNNPTGSSTFHPPNRNTKHVLEPANLDGLSPSDSTTGKVELQNMHQRNDGYFGQMKMQLQPFQSNDGTIVYLDQISGQFFHSVPNILLNDAMINQQYTPLVNTFPHQKIHHHEESLPPQNDSKPVQSSLSERLPTRVDSKHIQSSLNIAGEEESLSENNSVSRSFSHPNIDDKSTRSSKGSTKSNQLDEEESSVENKSISRSFSSSQNMKKELNRQEILIKNKTSSRSFSPPNIDKKPRSAGSHQSVMRNKTVSRSFSPPNINDTPKRSSVDSNEDLKLNRQGRSMENNNTSYPPSQNNTTIPVDTQKMNRREELTLKKKAVSRSFSPPHIDYKHSGSSASHIQECEVKEHSDETEHVPRSENIKTELEKTSYDQKKLCSNDKSSAELESLSPSRSNHSNIANFSKELTNTVVSSSSAQENLDTTPKVEYSSTHMESKARNDQSRVYTTEFDQEKDIPKVTDNESSKQRKHATESDRSPSTVKNLPPSANAFGKKDIKVQNVKPSDEEQSMDVTIQHDVVKNNDSRDVSLYSSQEVSLLQESTLKKTGAKVMSLEDYKKNRSRNTKKSVPSSKTRKRRNSLNKKSKSQDRSMSRESGLQSLDQSTFSEIISSSSSDYSSSRIDSGSTYSSGYSSSSSYSNSSRSYDSYDSEYSSDY